MKNLKFILSFLLISLLGINSLKAQNEGALLPPLGLEVFAQENGDINVQWLPVGLGGWMRMNSGTLGQYLVMDGDMFIAAEFGSDVLPHYNGMKLSQVSFVVRNSMPSSASLLIWHSDQDPSESNTLCSGQVTTHINLEGVTTVTLTNPIVINTADYDKLYIGINYTKGSQASTLGMDSGPMISGGGWVKIATSSNPIPQWYNVKNLGVDKNFIIDAWIDADNGETKKMVSSNLNSDVIKPTGFNIYRNGEKINNELIPNGTDPEKKVSYIDNSKVEGKNIYTVKSVNDGTESEASVPVTYIYQVGLIDRKYVVAEMTTYLTCPNCPTAAKAIDNLKNTKDVKIAVIEYHTADQYTIPGIKERLMDFYDGINVAPVGIFDGKFVFTGADLVSEYPKAYNNRIKVKSPFDIEVKSQKFENNQYTITFQTKRVGTVIDDDLIFFSSVIESHIPVNWGGGSEINDVCRLMPNGHFGTELDLTKGDVSSFDVTFEMNKGWNKYFTEIVVFVQCKTDKEILQALKVDFRDFFETDGTYITGKVLNSVTNKPVINATVKLGTKSTVTDSDGVYNFYEIPTGTYNLEVNHSDYNVASIPVEVTNKEDINVADILLNAKVVKLSGRILAQKDQTPVSGAVVKLNSQSTKTTKNGNFVFSKIESGTKYILTVEQDGYDKYTNELDVEFADINLGEILLVEKDGVESLSGANFKLYPNPVKNVLNISGDKQIDGIKIYNSNGALIYSANEIFNEIIDVSSFSNGLYIINVIIDGKPYSDKFTVNK